MPRTVAQPDTSPAVAYRSDRGAAWATFGALAICDLPLAVHAVRSTALALEIASEAGLPTGEGSFWGFLLHDVGMLQVPVELLEIPGSLPPEHRNVVVNHPLVSARVCKALTGRLDDLSEAVEVVLSHHERWDGHGYPSGLSRTDIPLAARVLSVADVYAALTDARPQRGPHEPWEALELILEQSGSSFDPVLVSAFERIAPALHPDLVRPAEAHEIRTRLGEQIWERVRRGSDIRGAQLDALFAVLLGLGATEAADRLGRAPGTHRTWMSSLRRALAVPHRMELCRFLAGIGHDTFAALQRDPTSVPA